MRIGVLDGLVPQHPTGRLEVLDDHRVGVEDHQTLVRRDLRGEASARIERLHHLDAVGGREFHVLLTEGGSEVHDAGAVLGGHVVAQQHPVGARMSDEEVERRCVGKTFELRSAVAPEDLGLTEFLGVAAQQRLREQILLTVGRCDVHVLDVGMHGNGQVGRQGPRRGRPDQRVDPVER